MWTRSPKMLENHQITLLKDVAMFDQMYELNLKYYKELTMYILAGKKRLAEVRATELEALRKKAEQTGSGRGRPGLQRPGATCATALRRSSTIWS